MTQGEKLRAGSVRVLRSADLLKCPHVILMPDHYREDGSCRCNDPEHVEMADWGYTWEDGKWK